MWRLRPTWRPPRPERSSSSGVPRAPPATIVARRARTVWGRRMPSPTAGATVVQRTPTARPSSTRTRLRLHPGADSRPGGDGARQVADVHAALGVDLAAEGAGAALHAVAGVAGDRATGGAQRQRSLHRELSVAAHPLGIELRHPQELLGLGVVGAQLAGPGDAVAPPPVLEDRVGGAEAGAGVDHRRAADRPRDRDRDRRAALGDRQAAVAVEGGDRLERVARVAVAVVVLTRLQHDHVEARLGQRRRG